MKPWKRWTCGCLLGVAGIASATAAEPSIDPTRGVADWTDAQPVASISIRPLSTDEAPPQLKDRDGLFVVEGTVIDLRSGNTLMKPRLIVHRGDRATIEGGVTDRLMMKVTVLIDASVDRASTTTELRDGGVVTSSSTTHFSFAPF